MYRTILVPLDGSTFAERALDCAVPIAERSHTVIHLLCVSDVSVLNPPHREGSGPWLDAFREQQEDYLRGVSRQFGRDGGPQIRTAVIEGVPAHVIAEYARTHGCDLIVMTSHGRGGLERAWLGSVTTAVLRDVTVPVLVVRAGVGGDGPNEAWTPRTIVAALDESETAENALRHGAELAALFEAELLLVEVAPPPTGPASVFLPHAAEMLRESHDESRAEAAGYLAVIERRYADRVPPIRAVRSVVDTHTSVPHGILGAAADADADVIAVGTHGLGLLRRTLLGSVADKVLRGSDRPVLVVRGTSQ